MRVVAWAIVATLAGCANMPAKPVVPISATRPTPTTTTATLLGHDDDTLDYLATVEVYYVPFGWITERDMTPENVVKGAQLKTSVRWLGGGFGTSFRKLLGNTLDSPSTLETPSDFRLVIIVRLDGDSATKPRLEDPLLTIAADFYGSALINGRAVTLNADGRKFLLGLLPASLAEDFCKPFRWPFPIWPFNS